MVRDAVNTERRPQRRARDRRLPSDRRPWLLVPVALLALTIIAVAVLEAAKRFPLGTLVFGTIFAPLGHCHRALHRRTGGHRLDRRLLDWIVSSRVRARYAPLEFDQVGEVLIVKLSDHIVSDAHCQAVQRQLDRFVDEHYCDFILDFSAVGRLSRSFRGVMTHLAGAARRRGGAAGQARSGPSPCRLERYSACSTDASYMRRKKWAGTTAMDGFVLLPRPPGDPSGLGHHLKNKGEGGNKAGAGRRAGRGRKD